MTPHAEGSFCWSELVAPDTKRVKLFYTRLLDWQVHDDPLPSGGVYHMFSHRNKNVCASFAGEFTPHWRMYASVVDVDAAVKRAQTLGARIVEAPSDVGPAGRQATIDDPTGARLHLWQAKGHIGAHALHQPGALTWFELATRDLEAAETFYQGLFGWTTTRKTLGDRTLTHCERDGKPIAALLRMNEPWGLASHWADKAPHWYCYFQVRDCGAAAAQVKGYGGEVLVPTQAIAGIGHFAMIRDPAGAVVGLMDHAR